MGNQQSSSSSSRRKSYPRADAAAEHVKKVVGEVHEEIKKSVKKLDEDHPAAQFFDSVCGGGYFDEDNASQASSRYHHSRKKGSSFYSEDNYSEDGSRTVSEDETTAYDDRSRRSRADNTVESQSYMSQSDYDSDHRHNSKSRGGGGGGGGGAKSSSARKAGSFDTEGDDTRTEASSTVAANAPTSALQKQPLASSFAKRCYFTKAGIGRTTQHYEGLTLTGNVVLMLASAMKLKGCPTICDEDLRRVEQTYPNQFSRLPDELLLSSGWRRISKYCHFSNKPIPDGVPFFHSKQRLHPSGGYYFLLAAAVGMTRPMDVEPLNRDTLVLLETDYPTQCDSAPTVLIKDHEQWTLVNKFCFFSGGPINTEEDVYYQADFDGNPIYMLAFLSPSLTPDELYKLNDKDAGSEDEPSLKTIAAVQEVESVYDLTERDFDDLKLYHLGPCRALPQYILTPQAWVKILPPHFLAARQQAMIRAEEYMQRNGLLPDVLPTNGSNGEIMMMPNGQYQQQQQQHYPMQPRQAQGYAQGGVDGQYHGQAPFMAMPNNNNVNGPGVHISPGLAAEFQREIEEEGAFHDDSIPIDEAQNRFLPAPYHPNPSNGRRLVGPPAIDAGMMMYPVGHHAPDPTTPKLDPPDDEPPSLHKGSMEYQVPDPEDPSVMLSPGTPANPDGQNFFNGDGFTARSGSGSGLSPSRRMLPRSSYEARSNRDDPMSPEDENQSTNLISLGSPESQSHPSYDPFASHDTMTLQQQQQQYQQQPFVFGMQPQAEDEAEPSIHYRPRPNVRALDPLYTDRSPTHSDLGVTPAHFSTSPRHMNPSDYDGGEEKKASSEESSAEGERVHLPYSHSQRMSQDSHLKDSSGESHDYNRMQQQPQYSYHNGDEDYGDGEAEAIISPHSVESEVSHQSAAFRSAQEVLRKNRRRRMEEAMKQDSSDPPEFEGSSTSPTAHSHGGWESESDVSGSNVSGSSLWSEGSGNSGDRSSRRALILQMAKARMRNNNGSPNKLSISSKDQQQPAPILEEEMSLGGQTEGAQAEIDIAGDLD